MASSLHDDAYKGTLTQVLIDQYLSGAQAGFIDCVGGEKKLTPLASACLRGHVGVVQLLLDNGANPDALSTRDRPPLFYVTSRTTKNRVEIVRALLAAHADVDKRFPKDLNSTALMNALTEVRDKDVVHELVDSGADLDAQNSDGQSVRQLAKEVGMEQELLTKAERNAKRGAIIDLIVALVMFVIAVVNSGIIKDTIVGAVSKLYEIQAASEKDKAQMKDMAKEVLGASEAAQNFTKRLDGHPVDQMAATNGNSVGLGSGQGLPPNSNDSLLNNSETLSRGGQAELCILDRPAGVPAPPAEKTPERLETLASVINTPPHLALDPNDNSQPVGEPERSTSETPLVSIDDFKGSLGDYVHETGLEKFFARDDTFIQDLAEKAAALTKDGSTLLSKPENVKRLVTLSLYHPVFYCDDSGSMGRDSRFVNQRHLVNRMARVATKIVPDGYGVELRFINSKIVQQNLDTIALDRHLANTQPRGGTRIGTVLRRDILSPLVYQKVEADSAFRRPLLVCAITDGNPSSESPTAFKDAIVECRRKLVAAGYEPSSVMFCISQIGNDEKAAAFLAELRDDEEIQDVLYCTAERLDGQFEEMRANEDRLEEWLLKLLTKPIMERYEE